jgi:hypothetical protein
MKEEQNNSGFLLKAQCLEYHWQQWLHKRVELFAHSVAVPRAAGVELFCPTAKIGSLASSFALSGERCRSSSRKGERESRLTHTMHPPYTVKRKRAQRSAPATFYVVINAVRTTKLQRFET